jgi:hypothetical protein
MRETGSQRSWVVQGFMSAQSMSMAHTRPPVQPCIASHISPARHRAGTALCWQTPPMQTSSVHAIESSQRALRGV